MEVYRLYNPQTGHVLATLPSEALAKHYWRAVPRRNFSQVQLLRITLDDHSPSWHSLPGKHCTKEQLEKFHAAVGAEVIAVKSPRKFLMDNPYSKGGRACV